MKRVYTDERFPGIEVHNDGTTRFVIVSGGKEEDAFTTYGGNGQLTEEEAARRAQSYFDRMAQGLVSDELWDRSHGGFGHMRDDGHAKATRRVQLPDDDDTAAFNNPPPPRGKVDLGQTVDADAVIDLYKRAMATADPEERQKLMQQVQSMAQQLESTSEAKETVNRLLD